MLIAAPLLIGVCAAGLVGALPHLYVRLARGGPRSFQEQRMRNRLLPLVGPEEIVTCRPYSSSTTVGWLCTIIGMALLPVFADTFCQLSWLALRAGSKLPQLLVATGTIKAFGDSILIAAFELFFVILFLRIGLDIFNFDCIVTDKQLVWYDGVWGVSQNSCPLLDITDVTTQVILWRAARMRMVTVTISGGRRLRLFALENEQEFSEALEFEYPASLSFWKAQEARRKVF